ncbi:ribosomal protein S18-alanine N-acetyltransferase [Peribacillus alkalitolerans]|uniref:ribosomal protein S18-alanine N-acetyltransferase n=1 Tax=Peribacillus alkalitolerans TaxID=1550385 RepID=UPI0013D4F2DA|nr:ribosomal protein S18-alanine N-acetyltransferase [Peribacillus alkalitolerans]
MENKMIIRLMTDRDLEDVLELEHQSFTLPWSKEAFYNELHHNQHAIYVVIEDKGKIVGYCGTWLIIDEAHITNIAILPSYRGRGLGEKLLTHMMNVTRSRNVVTMTLEVRVSNLVAQSLYEKLGFKKGGIRKNYYSDNGEDAIVMWVNFQ